MDPSRWLGLHRTPLIGCRMDGLVFRVPFFPQASCFALPATKEVKFGSANVRMAQHFDLFDPWRMKRESPLDANTVGCNPAHGELGVCASASAHAHNGASHQLDPLAIAFDDAVVDLHIITHLEMWQIRFQADIFLLLLYFH